MLWWLVDNIHVFQVILGMLALGFGAAFYLTKRVKFLALAGLMVAGIVLLWFVPQLIITDRKRLELTIREMADAVVEQREDILLSRMADDFEFGGLKRGEAARRVVKTAKTHEVTYIKIWGWKVESLDRAAGVADVYFGATAQDRPFRCRGRFRLTGGQWKLQKIEIFNAFVDQDVPLQFHFR